MTYAQVEHLDQYDILTAKKTDREAIAFARESQSRDWLTWVAIALNMASRLEMLQCRVDAMQLQMRQHEGMLTLTEFMEQHS